MDLKKLEQELKTWAEREEIYWGDAELRSPEHVHKERLFKPFPEDCENESVAYLLFEESELWEMFMGPELLDSQDSFGAEIEKLGFAYELENSCWAVIFRQKPNQEGFTQTQPVCKRKGRPPRRAE